MKKTVLILFALFSTMTLLADDHPTTYPFVVKFNSFGTGVSSDKPLLAYIATFKKKYKIKNITYMRIGPMGREGEYHMAFPLKEMTKTQAAVFMREVKKVVAKIKDKGSVDTEVNYDAGSETEKMEKKMI
jgi:hypothetical protein